MKNKETLKKVDERLKGKELFKESNDRARKILSEIKSLHKQHSFCETPKVKCTMNYCDENGCQNRKRELVEPKQETFKKK